MKLHLGCGKSNIKGWLHVDIRKQRHLDVMADATALPFKTGSFETLYASHLLEHFRVRRCQRVLREWRRVLKKGGELMVAVPNFDAIIYGYVRGRVFDNWFSYIICGDQTAPWAYHKNVFVTSSLEYYLLKAGFKKAEQVTEFSIPGRSLDCSDLHGKGPMSNIRLSLNMVAVK